MMMPLTKWNRVVASEGTFTTPKDAPIGSAAANRSRPYTPMRELAEPIR